VVPPAAAAPADAQPARPGTVVVVGVPDLRWEDVSPATTPTLWQLADRSSVAAMTDRSGEPVAARRATGWVTLNTGSRARSNVGAFFVPDPAVPTQLAALRTANERARYRSQVGALGDALRQAGLTVAATGGPGAVLGAMASDGTVTTSSTSPAVPKGADVVVVELPQLYDVGRQDAGAVRGALTVIDAQVAALVHELPTDSTMLLAGVSDAATGTGRLHVAMATGPSFGPGRLTSGSTGRDGVVQLIDLAPTVLGLEGVPVPASMLGAPWRATAGSAAPLAQEVAGFVDLDVRSLTQRLDRSYYPAVVALALLFLALVLLSWRRRRTGWLRPLGAVVAAVPVAGYLPQLVPWWRVGTWPIAALTAAVAVAIGLGAAGTPWARRSPWGTPALVGGFTALVLAADAATGSSLSLDAPFADNPIIAGRFHGIGNVAFALLGAGTLVLAAAAAADRPPRRGALAVVVLGALAVVVDALPTLGDDFGGVLALVPAVAVLAFAVSGVRVAGRHVLAVVGAAVVLTAGVALYDYSRPADLRTHLGRFVAQVVDGSAWAVVHRKLDTALGTLTGGWPRWIVAGWLVLAVVVWLGARSGRLALCGAVDRRAARGLVLSLVVLGIVGAAVNDSGVEIPAFVGYLAVPLLVPLLAPVRAPSPSPAEQRSSAGSGRP
jgi:hypothetical protein